MLKQQGPNNLMFSILLNYSFNYQVARMISEVIFQNPVSPSCLIITKDPATIAACFSSIQEMELKIPPSQKELKVKFESKSLDLNNRIESPFGPQPYLWVSTEIV